MWLVIPLVLWLIAAPSSAVYYSTESVPNEMQPHSEDLDISIDEEFPYENDEQTYSTWNDTETPENRKNFKKKSTDNDLLQDNNNMSSEFDDASERDENYIRLDRSEGSSEINYEKLNDIQNSEFHDPLHDDTDFEKKKDSSNGFLRLGRDKGSSFLRLGRGKSDGFLRFGKSKDNFLRYGRERPANYLRFGRNNPNNFLRFGRDKSDNFLRFGKGKPDSFIRYGRGKPMEDSFLRLGRGKPDNYLRSGRDNAGNFLRFGRDKEKNFLRFGRDTQNNFLRFGRDKQDNFPSSGKNKQDNFLRLGRVSPNNFLRFGRSAPDDFLRFGRDKQNNYLRFGRGKQDNFLRLGRGKGDDFLRFGRDQAFEKHPRVTREKNGNFLRFGKGDEDHFPLEDLQDNSIDMDLLFDEFLAAEENDLPLSDSEGEVETDEYSRMRRGKDDRNFLRLGRMPEKRGVIEPGADNVQILRLRRSGNANSVRFGRGKLTDSNFIRLGRSTNSKLAERGESAQEYGLADNKRKNENVIRFGRSADLASGGDNFVRLGRNMQLQHHDKPTVIGVRRKRSVDNSIPSVPYDHQENIIHSIEELPLMPKRAENYVRFG